MITFGFCCSFIDGHYSDNRSMLQKSLKYKHLHQILERVMARTDQVTPHLNILYIVCTNRNPSPLSVSYWYCTCTTTSFVAD